MAQVGDSTYRKPMDGSGSRPKGGRRGAKCDLRGGFSRVLDGFRPKRSQHDALDALIVGITTTKVNWILDVRFLETDCLHWILRDGTVL